MPHTALPFAPARFLLPLLPLLALLAVGCHPMDPSEPPDAPVTLEVKAQPEVKTTPFRPMCTLELRILAADVVDACGRPVVGATVVVSDPEGSTRTVEQGGIPWPEKHVVFTDGLLPLDPAGTLITARFSKDGKTHVEEYLLASDGCHFRTLSAPDTVRTLW